MSGVALRVRAAFGFPDASTVVCVCACMCASVYVCVCVYEYMKIYMP